MNVSKIASQIIQPSIKSFGQILFSQDIRVGVLVILSMAAFHPLGAAIAFIVTIVCHAMIVISQRVGNSKLQGISQEDYQDGLYGFNGALLAIGASVFFGFTLWVLLALVPLSLLANQLWLSFYKRGIPLFTLPATLLVLMLLNMIHINPETSSLHWGIQGFSQIIYIANPITACIIAAAILLAYYKNLVWFLLGSGMSLLSCFIFSDDHFLSLMLANQLLFACYLSSTQRPIYQLTTIALVNAAILILIFYLLFNLSLPVMVFPYIVASMITSYMLKKQYGSNLPIRL
jgi:urea transporter